MDSGRGPTGRVVAVLNFLAAHPDQRFSLSELSRKVEISKATLHAIISALSGAGYVTRDPDDRTVMLGPALIHVANSVFGKLRPVLEAARPWMIELSEEFGECVVSMATGDQIVVLAHAVDGQVPQRSRRMSTGSPLAPPIGTVFMAWAAAGEVDAWLRRVDDGGGSEQRTKHLRQALDEVRRRGFAVAVGVDPRARIRRFLDGLGSSTDVSDTKATLAGLLRELDDKCYLPGSLVDNEPYQVDHIAAPIFDPGGRVALALALVGLRDRMSGKEVCEAGDRLAAIARHLTATGFTAPLVEPTNGSGLGRNRDP